MSVICETCGGRGEVDIENLPIGKQLAKVMEMRGDTYRDVERICGIGISRIHDYVMIGREPIKRNRELIEDYIRNGRLRRSS